MKDLIYVQFVMDKIIVAYLYIFIPVSLLTGFMLRNNITVGGLTPSLFLTAGVIILLSVFYAKKVLRKSKIHSSIIWGIIIFSFFPMIYLLVHGYSYVFEEYNYSITILASIFIITYLSNYSRIELIQLEKILHISNIILIANILLSWLLDIGYPSYISGGIEIGNKGYLYGGNTASALSIAVLAYYLFKNENNVVYKWISIVLSFTAAIFVKTIASILAPLFVLLYFSIKSKFKLFYLVAGIIFIIVTPYAENIINEYLEGSYRVQRMTDPNRGFTETRRLYDSYLQLEYQLENPLTIFVGTGRSGQIDFWNRNVLNFAGMDISDIIMRYGLLGFIFISIIYVKPIIKYFLKFKIDSVSVSSSIILLYGFFGGYLFTSITSLIYLSLLIAYINISLKNKKEIDNQDINWTGELKYNA